MKILLTLSLLLGVISTSIAQHFTPIEIYPNFSITNWSGDLDGDDDADIVFIGDDGSDKLYIAEQTSEDMFNVVDQGRSHHILSTVRLGDMDNDLDLDIVIADYDDSVYVYYNEGNLNFSRVQFFVGDWCSDLELFDADQDDTLDIALAARSQNSFVIYENDYTGFLPHVIDNSNTLINKMYAVDVDNNNRVDLYSVGLHGGTGAGTVCRYMNNGNFNFSKSTIATNGEYDISVGLLDGDMNYDFITSNSYTGRFKLWKNNGSFGYTSQTLHTLASGYSALATGYADFDLDSDIDFVFGDEESAGLVVYWNMGSDVYELDTILVDHDVYEVQVTDYDNDGDADILSASATHGVFLMKNDRITAGIKSEEKSNVSIYPNPTKTEFTIQLDHTFNGHYQIITLDGQQVLERKVINTEVFTVPTNQLENGYYFIQLIENNTVRTFQVEVLH